MISLPHPIPMPEFLWNREAAAYLEACMRSRSETWAGLAAELTLRGTAISPEMLEARVSRADVSAGLFFKIMHVLMQEQVAIADVDPYDGVEPSPPAE
ncbi:DUF6471 domain-containing protein [Salinarimonas chemoclinalis]|uniref:DUF6471 domain-containing protein n=1 Tax=Salinarimonas chemoclinalis TaxID=3241599 RepID=UPI003559130C